MANRPEPGIDRRGLLVAAAGLVLAGCTETVSDLANAPPRARAPGVPVAVVSLDGAPEAILQRVNAALGVQAQRRDIQIVPAVAEARYKMRGYLAAYAAAEGTTELAWTWDIFDAASRRARRVSGATAVRQTAADPWSVIGEAQVQALAVASLDDVAEFLAAAPAALPPVAAGAGNARRAAGLLATVGVR
jgi:hypothetical protein